jgi:hypothetical protein
VVIRFHNAQLRVCLTYCLCSGEEGDGALQSDLGGDQVILPIPGKELLLEFEDEQWECELCETCKVHVNPRLDGQALKVVDDSKDTVRLCYQFVLEISVAGILKNAHGSNGDSRENSSVTGRLLLHHRWCIRDFCRHAGQARQAFFSFRVG